MSRSYNCVVIDNTPIVTQEKAERLGLVIQKVIASANCTPIKFELCQDESGTTLGYCFVEFKDRQDAEKVKAKLDNQKLDKQHIFKVTTYAQWEQIRSTPEEFVAPAKEVKVQDDTLVDWLLVDGCKEQYAVRYADETEIVSFAPQYISKDIIPNDTVDLKKSNFTENVVSFSPQGTYIATFHQQGLQLWGGSQWKVVNRIPHSQVKALDFSPKENYVVTWFNNLTVWETKTGAKLKTFPGGPRERFPGDAGEWPVFKWSHDEQYFARVGDDNIQIYDVQNGCKHLVFDKKRPNVTLFIPGVLDFEWSPADNILAFWVPEIESENKPAAVQIIRLFRSKNDQDSNVEYQQITQHSLYRVVDIKGHWQSNGDFFGVKVDRVSKLSKEKAKVTGFVLFRIKSKEKVEKTTPFETFEINTQVIAFAWEPKGLRFAVIHKMENSQKNSVSFYHMGNVSKGPFKKLETLENRLADHLFWSPKGKCVVLAGLSSAQGSLEFYNIEDKETMATTEHYLCTAVDWDPSGRYVSTSVQAHKHHMENGYKIWSFQGRQVLSHSREKFVQFLWRPRPPSLLSEDRLKKIQKQLKDRATEYEEAQKQIDEMAAQALLRERQAKLNEFTKFVEQRRKDMLPLTLQRREERRAAGVFYDSDDESNIRTIEEKVDEVIAHDEYPV